MAVYSISDLHLSFSSEKPMDVFGDSWNMHYERIKNNWKTMINEDDMILICGDISWAIDMDQAMVDLKWIDELPGKKIISKGNHDYWWGSISKLNNLFENTRFLQNNYYVYNDYAICGTRGWICPGLESFTESDEKIYKRELIRLTLSVEAAIKAGYTKIVVMLHYPPVNDKFEPSGFTEIFKKYNIEKVLYGHLHGPFNSSLFHGISDGVEYVLTSCDYLNFKPVRIL
ncbi:metallophosphoesterase [Clostridium oryzae]|uniref:3',5'-cyclic adenosine monophosphate phosphodiesterase CpdA n=1 Tax=Clostridium oryzae TaxID=1450648 RepID=A0A1V4IJC6_9CLOT|nr:metallophosphoesterase [Clostridium oryzae]OPJ60101.1 3',5'-cyclic adenosine monophosphate phosphodiesterase CpdA [Clostridium oryzae]